MFPFSSRPLIHIVVVFPCSPHPTTHHLILRAQGFRAAFLRGDHIELGLREVEGRAEDARFHFIGQFRPASDRAPRAFHPDSIAIADAFPCGIQGMDEQEVFAEDLDIPGPAGHVAAVVMGERAVGGEDVGVVFLVFSDLVGFLEGDEGEPAFPVLEFPDMEDTAPLAIRL